MSASRAKLLEKAKQASQKPGVYLMRGEQGQILYVGKAKNLRNRLTTYFQPAAKDSLKVELLVGNVAEFETILTETEAEALILECTLIKKHKPKYNIQLKDDKAYPYIKVSQEDAFPRLEFTRRLKKDGARYFGPFTSAWSAREVMRLLTETYRLRDCSDNTFRHRSRPCILYQMDRCSGPCVAKISAEDYRASMREAVGVLDGAAGDLVGKLRERMHRLAEDEEYEAAAEVRDQVDNLELITQTQGVMQAEKGKDRDVVGVAREGERAHGTVLQIRAGQLIAVKHYHFQNMREGLSDAQVLFDFLAQHYVGHFRQKQVEENKVLESREVLVPQAPAETELLENTFDVRVVQARTSADQQLQNVANTNAQHGLVQSQRREKGHGLQALEEIQEKLHLEQLPVRVECYDISNIQGEDAVASRVVFINGAPTKDLYRRYKIRTVEGANDFAMMKEVLDRRFSRGEEQMPDLVVVDGGKGQLAQAVAILEELDVQGVAVVGLAKARVERSFRSREVESSRERIFIPKRKNPVPLYPHTGAYQLLVHIRDEAHRFAISYHRKLRDKRTLGTK